MPEEPQAKAADAPPAEPSPSPAEVEILPPAKAELETALPPGVKPTRNYVRAIEIGHVLAQSGFYPDARDPAKAAVKVMIGMDLGLSPTASLQAIHVITDKEGKVSFLIEGKLFAALLKATPGCDYKFAPVDPEDPSKGVRRSDEEVAIDFYRDGEKQEPTIVWNLERAKKAGLTGKGLRMYEKYPAEMLTWRGIAEGVRIFFPDLIAGNPVYAEEEWGGEEGSIREASAPAKAQPLTDAKAESLREKMREVFDELKAINPDRLVAGRFAQVLAGAEHSHAALEAKITWLEDLRDSEKVLAEKREQLIERLGEKEAQPIIDRAERRGSNRERIDVVEKALAAAAEGDEKPEEAAGDGDPS